MYLSYHLHHHLKTIFSERVILWEGAGIEDEEIKLCVKQEKLSCCPLYTCQAGHNLSVTWYLSLHLETSPDLEAEKRLEH